MTPSSQFLQRLTLIVVTLALVSSPVTQARAQTRTSNPCTDGTVERAKFGTEWDAMSDVNRSWWLEGFIDGQAHSFRAWDSVTSLPKEKVEQLRLELFPIVDRDALQHVMTSLYSDPANVFITREAMLYIAKAKLNGKETEGMLRYSRQNDCAWNVKKN